MSMNSKRLLVCFLIACVFGLSLPAHGGQFYGGNGYLHTNSALLLPPGALDLSLYARGFMTNVDIPDAQGGAGLYSDTVPGS